MYANPTLIMALAAAAAILAPLPANAPESAAPAAAATRSFMLTPPAADWSPRPVPLRDAFVGPRLRLETFTATGWGFTASDDGRPVGAPAPYGVDPNTRFNSVDIGYGWRGGNASVVIGYATPQSAPPVRSSPRPQWESHAGVTLTLHPH